MPEPRSTNVYPSTGPREARALRSVFGAIPSYWMESRVNPSSATGTTPRVRTRCRTS